MATSNLEFSFEFADGTVTKLTYGPFATTAAAVTNVKTNIATFNNAFNTGSFNNYFTNSNYQAPLAKPITAATVITQETTEFNLSENLLEEAAQNGESNS